MHDDDSIGGGAGVIFEMVMAPKLRPFDALDCELSQGIFGIFSVIFTLR